MRLAPLYQQDRELAKQEGEQRLIIRQLNRRIGEIESSLIQRVQTLSIEQLEELGEALLDFTSIEDLENWLQSVNLIIQHFPVL
jgi:predicted transposase YdaD